jgi:hypothetical protein
MLTNLSPSECYKKIFENFGGLEAIMLFHFLGKEVGKQKRLDIFFEWLTHTNRIISDMDKEEISLAFDHVDTLDHVN